MKFTSPFSRLQRQPAPVTVSPRTTGQYDVLRDSDSDSSVEEEQVTFLQRIQHEAERITQAINGPAFCPIDSSIIGIEVQYPSPSVPERPRSTRLTAGNNEKYCWTHVDHSKHSTSTCSHYDPTIVTLPTGNNPTTPPSFGQQRSRTRRSYHQRRRQFHRQLHHEISERKF